MARPKSRRKPLGTIWEISDDFWRRIEPILPDFWPVKPTGRKVANWRVMINHLRVFTHGSTQQTSLAFAGVVVAA